MRRLAIVVLLALPVLGLSSHPACAWGSATHAYVAKCIADDFVPGPRIFRPYMERQFAYGAMAPDLAWTAPAPLQESLGQATHRAPGYDDVVEVGAPSQAATISFALGWLTHNEEPGEAWGADFWAHDDSVGYVVGKAEVMAWETGLPEDLAHNYIEIAIDLLIDHRHDANIGEYVRRAALGRDWRVPGLVTASYPGFEAGALTDAERKFRNQMVAYGAGLSLPTPYDNDVAALGLALYANSSYGLSLSFGQSQALLAAATNLVRDDYWPALENTIEQARVGLWGWLATH